MEDDHRTVSMSFSPEVIPAPRNDASPQASTSNDIKAEESTEKTLSDLPFLKKEDEDEDTVERNYYEDTETFAAEESVDEDTRDIQQLLKKDLDMLAESHKVTSSMVDKSPPSTGGSSPSSSTGSNDRALLQTKVFIKDERKIGRIIGPKGETVKALGKELGCQIFIRGKGCRRGALQESSLEEQEDLHVLITVRDLHDGKAEKKLEIAKARVEEILNQPEGKDKGKKEQLRRLAELNGTLYSEMVEVSTPSPVSSPMMSSSMDMDMVRLPGVFWANNTIFPQHHPNLTSQPPTYVPPTLNVATSMWPQYTIPSAQSTSMFPTLNGATGISPQSMNLLAQPMISTPYMSTYMNAGAQWPQYMTASTQDLLNTPYQQLPLSTTLPVTSPATPFNPYHQTAGPSHQSYGRSQQRLWPSSGRSRHSRHTSRPSGRAAEVAGQ